MKRLLITLIFMFAAVAGASAQDATTVANSLRLADSAQGPLPAVAARRLESHNDPARPAFYDSAGWQFVDDKPGLFNVKAYGAKGNNAGNDTAAIQAAITACQSAGGGVVYFPPGVYRVTGLTVSASYVSLVGAGIGATVIANTSATGDTLATSGTMNGLQVRHMTFDPAVTRTNGREINVPAFAPNRGYVVLADLEFFDVNHCIWLGNAATQSGRIHVYNIHAETYDRFLTLVRVLDSTFHDWNLNAAKNATTSIHMDGGCEGNVFGPQLGIVNTAYVNNQNTGYNLHIKANLYTGSVSRFNKFIGVFFDSHATGLFAEDGINFTFTNCWFSSRPSAGAVISGTADDFKFIGCEFKNSGTAGIFVGGAGRHLIQGCSFTGNNAAGLANTNKFSAAILLGQSPGGSTRVLGNMARNALFGGNQQHYGLWIENGAGTRFTVKDNDFVGNVTGGINNLAGTSASRIVADNQQ